jgi:hypothetical protein
MNLSAVTSLIVVLLTGCARYEYQLVQPEQFAGHVGSKADYIVKLDPLEYHFQSASGRLVVQIHNPTDQNIQLRGEQSYVVDPGGQSHPLRSLSIAPNSYGKIIIPPMRPEIYDTGPHIGFGVGTYIGEAHHHHDAHCDAVVAQPAVDHPIYLDVYDDESYYWDLSGAGDLRMRFTYQRADKTFSDDFVMRRVKM